MNGFVVVRGDGMFVARSGSEHSYTNKLQNARLFKTRAEAEKDCCGNERVCPVTDFMPHF